MKHLVTTLAALALAASITAGIAYRAGGDRTVQAALAHSDAMEWLRVDFGLTDAQFAAIKKLHDDYSVICEEHCRAIQDATRTLRALKSAQASPAEIAAADREVQTLRLVCESAIATHVRRCAAEMSPEAGKRYLAMVLPKIKDFDHVAPPDLGLHHHHR
jgi:hypothetical protein